MLKYRCSIAAAAVLVALFSSRAADAQVVVPARQHGGLLNDLITGVEYDRVNRAKAEWHLPHLQAKLGRDARRGHSDAVDCDVRRIENHKFRIVVDGWLIRQNSLLDPGYYPYPVRLDPMTCAAIADAARPQEFPTEPQSPR